MRITNFETAEPVAAIRLSLSPPEVEELVIYLRALVHRPSIGPLFLSHLETNEITCEIALTIERPI